MVWCLCVRIWVFLVGSCSVEGFGEVHCLVTVFRFSVAVEFVLFSSLFGVRGILVLAVFVHSLLSQVVVVVPYGDGGASLLRRRIGVLLAL
ncbi:hypothetical protein A2U01_0038125 [Trifolium medium]|uniref:Uncharacterized protein n=1 Tax=Trifolium medium TaxID=97028 RepID=A0A392PZJ2_9FABA|nr:hypothetical protein [Trifolium medium]